MFKPHQIDAGEIRSGDILVWKGSGLIYFVLSRLIKWFKEPSFDLWGWHTVPMIDNIQFLDAQFPKVRIESLTNPKYLKRPFRAYRIFEESPASIRVIRFVQDKVGCWYDFLAYFLTALAVLLRPRFDIPRILDRKMTCWELTWEFADEMGFDITDDYCYPFLTDLLRLCGEIK